MKLRLLAEDVTKPETIEYVAEGVQRVVPVYLDLSVACERYSKGRVWLPNLWLIGGEFMPTPDEYLMILTHSSYSYYRDGVSFLSRFIGEDRPPAGLCDNDNRIIVVGGENSPSNDNIKLASHEICHAVLKHPATWDFESVHCKNYVGDKRCIMNLPGITRNFEEVYMGFCQPCADAMKAKEEEEVA